MYRSSFGLRLKTLREKRRLSQQKIAEILGFGNRQIVSDIEKGVRILNSDEILHVVKSLDVPLDYFLNPFLIVGEGRFCWCYSGVSSDALDKYEDVVSQWFGAYRAYAVDDDRMMPVVLPRVGLNANSSDDQASFVGERLSRYLGLGDVPSQRLVEAIEERLGILVLMADAIPGVSVGACRLPSLNGLLVNRNVSATRRNFDIAHQLFHLLTWDAMPPDRMDGKSKAPTKIRTEALADKFATALLVPTTAIQALPHRDGDLVGWLNASAAFLGVSSATLKSRLVSLGVLTADEALAARDEQLHPSAIVETSGDKPALLSKRLMRVMSDALMAGRISDRRSASLLDMTLDDVIELCESYGLSRPFDL